MGGAPNDMAETIESLKTQINSLKLKIAEIESCEKYGELVIQSTGLGIWDWEVQTGAASFNERWANIIGYRLEELYPVSIDTWTEYAHPDDLKESERLLKECWAGETDYYIFESRMKHKNGSWVWVYDTGRVIEWESDGVPKRMIGTHIDIDDRKQLEKELQESDDKYSRVIGNLSEDYFFYSHDLEGVFTFVSESVTSILGYSQKEFILHYDDYLTDNPINKEVKQKIGNAILGIKQAPYVIEILHNSGDKRWLEVSEVPVFEEDSGKVITIEGFAKDITKRKNSEELLRESEERFHIVSGISFDVIWEWNIAGGTHTWFGDIDTLLGYEKNKFPRAIEGWEGIIHPDDRNSFMEKLTKHHEEHIPWHEEYRIIRKNGEVRYVDDRGETRWDKEGTPLVMTGRIIDITERKQREVELQKLSRAVKYSSSAVYITDLDGNIEYINPKFTDITGYAEEDAIGLNYRILQSRETPDVLYTDIWEAILSEREWKGETQNRKKDGRLYWARSSISGVKDVKGEITHFVAIQEDVTHEYELTEQLCYQASHDALTGLLNRLEFEHRAEELLSTVRDNKDEHALCFIDLDQFKVVNDTCGHVAGDEMLRQLSTVLQETVRDSDTLARLGGDEFGILIADCSLDNAQGVAASLQKAIQNYQFSWKGHSFKVGVSMGLVPITETTSNLMELLIGADAACYMAKDKGRNRIHVYHPEDSEIARRHGEMQWIARIQHALEEDRFCLYAQSILPLDNTTDKHYELLIRMIDEKGEIVPPGAFLPAAERYNLITQIDRWVIENAFRLLAENPVFQSQTSFISINLSGHSLAEQDMLNFIIKKLDDPGIENEKVCFEITETAAISNLGTARQFISTLKELGCRFALDDFGSGLSSFAYLKNLSVDYLKIDGMFVKDIVDDPIDNAMVKSINEIGQVMGMQTIAEFVENDEIKGMLCEIGVNYAQGYGIHKPQPFVELLSPLKDIL